MTDEGAPGKVSPPAWLPGISLPVLIAPGRYKTWLTSWYWPVLDQATHSSAELGVVGVYEIAARRLQIWTSTHWDHIAWWSLASHSPAEEGMVAARMVGIRESKRLPVHWFIYHQLYTSPVANIDLHSLRSYCLVSFGGVCLLIMIAGNSVPVFALFWAR